MIDLTVVIKNIWPEWQVEKLLGQGSFGRVYEVSRKELDIERRSAVKVILVPPDTSEANALRLEGMTEDDIHTYYRETVKDFVSEIRLLNTLQGAPHIVNLEDFKVVGSKSGEMWCILIRMELLTPFTQHIVEHPMDEAEVIRLGAELCEALEICHGQNIIHRDIKPQNIFIDRYGSFKLGDFGIARKMEGMTSTLSQKGTFGYIAPEVVQGRKYDTRADIYSLGLVLYQLMNEGRAPFLLTAEDQRNPRARDEAMQRRLGGEQLPKPCPASSEFGKIILKACEYDPEKRFSSAAEMKDALLLLTEGRSATTKRKERKSGVDGTKIPDANRTVAVRHAGQSADDQHTVAVRRAKKRTDIREASGVSVSDHNTSKSKKVYVILSSVVALGLVVGGIFLIPHLLKNRPEEILTEKEEESISPPIIEPDKETDIIDSIEKETEKQEVTLEDDPQESSESIPVVTASGVCGDSLYWKILSGGKTNELVIYGTGKMYDYDYSNYLSPKGDGIPPWRSYMKKDTKLTLETGITSIGDYAFYDLLILVGELKIPDSVEEIGDSAFYNCDYLSGHLEIPNSVKRIGESAFNNCEGFTGDLIIPNSVTKIGARAFYNCSFDGNLIISESVSSIGYEAFSKCSNFTGNLKIPDSVISLGEHVFSYCSGFSGSLTIGNSLTAIPDYAFYYCTGFTGGLTIPDSVTTIGKYAFMYCRGFTGGLTIGNNVTSFGKQAFYNCSGFTGGLVIPNSVKNIGEGAFSHCSGLSDSLTLPSTVTVGDEAFHDCNFINYP